MGCASRTMPLNGTASAPVQIAVTNTSPKSQRQIKRTRIEREDFFCSECGLVAKDQPKNFFHYCSPKPVPFIEQRIATCEACPHNVDDVCLKYKEIHPDRNCLVSIGVKMPFAACPIGRWRKKSLRCPNCKRHTVLAGFKIACRYCGWSDGNASVPPGPGTELLHRLPQMSQELADKLDAKGIDWVDDNQPEVIQSLIDDKAIKRSAGDIARHVDMAVRFVSKKTGRQTNVSRAFSFGSQPARFVTRRNLAHDIATLESQIPSYITDIAGVARSGLAIATEVAMSLNLPLKVLRPKQRDIIDAGNGWRLETTDGIKPTDRHLMVIDDTVMTGNSLRDIQSIIASEAKEFASVTTAAVYVNPTAARKPDIHVHDLPWPHMLEWNLFNSVLLPSLVLDFDGIICHDPPVRFLEDEPHLEWIATALPKYLPRKAPVPLIVTARLEKYRAATEAYMKKFGVRCDRLVMHPAETLAERDASDIAAYKAEHFAEFIRTVNRRGLAVPPIFVESDDQQAKRIHELTGGLTVCPITTMVYQSRG